MKIEKLIAKLNSSNEYKDFVKEYPDAFLAAGFFIIDLESNQNINQVDFFIPTEKKIAAFTINDEDVKMQVLEAISETIPKKIHGKIKIDLDALNGILLDEMKNRNITENIKKIIAIVQNIKGKNVWNLNCVLSGMEMLRSHVEDETETVLSMERNSLMDLMQTFSQSKPPINSPEKSSVKDMDPQIELKQLNRLEKEIKRERERLKKDNSKNEKNFNEK